MRAELRATSAGIPADGPRPGTASAGTQVHLSGESARMQAHTRAGTPAHGQDALLRSLPVCRHSCRPVCRCTGRRVPRREPRPGWSGSHVQWRATRRARVALRSSRIRSVARSLSGLPTSPSARKKGCRTSKTQRKAKKFVCRHTRRLSPGGFRRFHQHFRVVTMHAGMPAYDVRAYRHTRLKGPCGKPSNFEFFRAVTQYAGIPVDRYAGTLQRRGAGPTSPLVTHLQLA